MMKMMLKNAENRGWVGIVIIENRNPQEHLLWKIDGAIDFKKI